MVLFLLVRPALSAGYSLDIELLRPSPTPDHIFGVDGPEVVEPRELRMITFAQVQKDPLVVYEFGEEADAVIGTRNAWHLGASYGLYEHVALRTVLPLAVQWGGESELAGSAGGLGDWSAGITWQAIERPFGSLGLRADFYAPTSAAQSYLGERDARFDVGLLASLDVGPIEALVDTTLMNRELVATAEDLDLGSEITTTAALRCTVHPRADLGVSALTRTGIGHFLQDAETPMEIVGGAQLHASERLQIDIGGGRGVLEGYGTTKLRAVLGMTFRAPPPERLVVLPPKPPIVERLPQPTIPVEPAEIWDPQRLVQLTAEVIEPTEPIRFRVNTAEVLPESLPALDATATLLAEHDEITLVAIEGHASEEGTYEHNYALSTARTLAIYQALIQRGIHPDRLALRPWGEPKPLATGATEDDLRANRAVVFLIERRRLGFEEGRDYGPAFISPVDGATIPIASPTAPPAPPPPAVDPSMFEEE
jgi:outer membrane protein OmpA-like peptidoglycan-associated protein